MAESSLLKLVFLEESQPQPSSFSASFLKPNLDKTEVQPSLRNSNFTMVGSPAGAEAQIFVGRVPE
jgi:hypothetical protein